jgi:hypothetical protein
MLLKSLTEADIGIVFSKIAYNNHGEFEKLGKLK